MARIIYAMTTDPVLLENLKLYTSVRLDAARILNEEMDGVLDVSLEAAKAFAPESAADYMLDLSEGHVLAMDIDREPQVTFVVDRNKDDTSFRFYLLKQDNSVLHELTVPYEDIGDAFTQSTHPIFKKMFGHYPAVMHLHDKGMELNGEDKDLESLNKWMFGACMFTLIKQRYPNATFTSNPNKPRNKLS